MTKRILHVVTNVAKYEASDRATGLWLGELTHAYDEFEKLNYIQDIVSPHGGVSPLEPKALAPLIANASVKARQNCPVFMEKLYTTLKPSEINWQDYDAIYYTGGHGVMFDFPNNLELQEITKNFYENGRIVSAVCHGYCRLLNVRLSNSQYLINGKKITSLRRIIVLFSR